MLPFLPAHAHEAWLIHPLKMVGLFDTPLSDVWTRVTVLSIATGCVLLIGLAVADYLDRRFQPLEQKLDRKYRDTSREWALLILRMTLGLLMVSAAFGLNPRHGTPYFVEPTLFVPDLELSSVTNFYLPFAGVELLIGAALILGIYVNFASLLTILLVFLGFYWFGFEIMFAYAGHILAPAFVLIIEDRDRFEHVTPRDAWPEKFVQKLLPFMTIERSLILFRVLVGLNFMYLAVMDKYLHSPQLETIMLEHNMPTFGIPAANLIFVMAAVELACGFALVIGIAERIVACVIIGAMMFFVVTLGESPLIHANIFGILIAIILLGPGYLSPDKEVAPAGQTLRLAVARVSAAGVMCVAIALSGLWVSDLRAMMPPADARLVHATGLPEHQPMLNGAQLQELGDGFYRILIDTSNFRFTGNVEPIETLEFQGHAHVYIGEEKLATLYAAEGIFGPVPEDTPSVTVSLMNPLHCFVATDDGLLAMEIPLGDEALTRARHTEPAALHAEVVAEEG
ncbi:MAG: DoxX family membrane protein [Pseudomonadota bacterium]